MPYIRRILTAFCIAALACFFSPPLLAEASVTPTPTLAPVLKKVVPAIVNVAVQGIIPNDVPLAPDENTPNPQGRPGPREEMPDDGQPRKFQSIGSGVIVDPEHGIILTNDHVIRNASLVTITLNDGRRLKAKVIGSDSATDVAVLKIDAKNLKSLPIGDSDKTEVGDFVMAIGNPFGLNSFGNSQTATFGIVSAKQRSDLNIEGIENFIQTDAAINPGSSGGALVNTRGELIGINTAIISLHGGNVGIGFAIPINMAKDVAQQIIKFGSIHRGLMGVFVQHLTPELSQAMGYSGSLKGALIAQVNTDSPAEAAGLKPGDIITNINNTKITQASQVKTTISLLRAGSNAKITVKRKDKDIVLTATVTDMKKQEQQMQASNPFLYGLSLREFEQDSPLHGHIVGVQIVGASENSAGWRAGLRPGDVIVGANHEPTKTHDALQTIAGKQKKQLLVQILRGAGALYILII
ncbi:MAG: Do family serine endopeptidase [Gammaproteobacteria bacterium]|nr:Do family serine endopeptidase [Gammaproteobacteria bacterium]